MPHRKSVTTLVGLTVAAIIVLAQAGPVLAQDDQDEALAYHAWFAANQAQDNAKAVEAAEAYLERFPNGQYADFLGKWLAPAQLAKLNEAIKGGDIDRMLEVGEVILANDPENLNVIIALARQLYRRELTARPRSFDHAAKATELSQQAIDLVESGKTLAGVQEFKKEATLAWLYQSLAIVGGQNGPSPRAIELYNKSTSLAPDDPAIAGRNLLELLSWQQSSYADAANAYNALPEEQRGAPEPGPAVQEARARVDTEADALIEVAASFVALAETRGLPQATRDKVYGILETVYKSRNPEDADAAGLQAVIDAKK